jgi:hypothetical protein
VEFDYQVRNSHGELKQIHRVAAIERTPCRFGVPELGLSVRYRAAGDE